MSDLKDLPIPDWYAGKCVFITGGTGFIGKILVEKLLRSVPDIDTIYMLVRYKKGKGLDERLGKYLECPIFDVVRGTNPDAFKKIVCLHGDAAELNLGLSDADAQTLKENVSVVFHAAASVRFDQPLKDAILLNTRGTFEIVKLAADMLKLEVLVHVSTAYTNNEYQFIKEKVYPPRADWSKMIKLAETCDRHQLDVYCEKVLGKQSNTYTFTKCLAENLIDDYKHILPVVIYRPTVVLHTDKEPFPGFSDSLSSVSSIFVASGKGFLRICTSITDMHYAPVDWVVNGMIAIAWHRAKHENVELVYATFSARISPKLFSDIGFKYNAIRPVLQMWHPFLFFVSNKLLYWVLFMLLHIVPAVLIDSVLAVIGQPTRFLKLYRRTYVALDNLDRITSRYYNFYTTNYQEVESFLTEVDKKNFYMKETVTDEWVEKLVINGMETAKLCLLNEPYKKMHLTLHNIFKFLHYTLLIFLGWYIHSKIPYSGIYTSAAGYITDLFEE